MLNGIGLNVRRASTSNQANHTDHRDYYLQKSQHSLRLARRYTYTRGRRARERIGVLARAISPLSASVDGIRVITNKH